MPPGGGAGAYTQADKLPTSTGAMVPKTRSSWLAQQPLAALDAALLQLNAGVRLAGMSRAT